ncbi:MerR family transcriptional regulator [Oenococcus sp.]|uniref:MerR family transcriptional regulator n=1 Tax=Oenococcus sp. TaxID=1979414 RepID=UPI0039E9AC3D
MNIKEASEITKVSADTIRYYEKIGLIPAINRTESGIRDFDERIIGRVNFVKQMRSAGMSIQNLQQYMQLADSNEDHIQEQKELLQDQLLVMEEKRDDLQAAINHLTWKLDHYEDHMAKAEAELSRLEKQNKKSKRSFS